MVSDLGAHLAAWAPWLAALALTLVLAAWLTPARWWRRPNLRALAVLAGGTLAFGALLAPLLPIPSAAARTPRPVMAVPTSTQAPTSTTGRPAVGARYRVAYALNLRHGAGVHAARVAVLPAGALVVATGAVEGDWWQVRARSDGADQEGWASSLWLRRTDEAGQAPLE